MTSSKHSSLQSVILFLFFLSQIQCIRDYYVSPTVESTAGNCSARDSPCSLSRAISEASIYASTTTSQIFLLSGQYEQNNDIIIKDFKDITISAETVDSLVYLWTNSTQSSVFSVENSSVTFEHLNFNSSISTPLVIDAHSYVTIYFSSFSNNTANSTSLGGGAIYSLSPLIINYCTFTDNYVGIPKPDGYFTFDLPYLPISLKGGAIYGNESINILDSSFFRNFIRGNINEGYGGAIYGGYLVRINHCDIETNSIIGQMKTAYGGAIYSEDSLALINSTIDENLIFAEYSDDLSEYYPFITIKGGAIYTKGKFTAEYPSISSNTIMIGFYLGFARVEGGGIYCEDEISITTGHFDRNIILMDCSYSQENGYHNAMGYGAAISASTHMKMEIIHSEFTINSVYFLNSGSEPRYIDADGGAIEFFVGDIINSTFSGNSVTVWFENSKIGSGSSLTGGAIGCSAVNIQNSLFFDNLSNFTGGAVQIWNDFNIASNIINSTFNLNSAIGMENSAGGSIASVDDINTDIILLSIQDCLFTSNTADIGDDIYVKNIGYEIIDSGYIFIDTVDSVFFNPSTSMSASLSQSISPSVSSSPSVSPSFSRKVEKSKNDMNNDSNLIIIMSVSSILGVFIVVGLLAGAVAALSLFKIRQQKKLVAHKKIEDINDLYVHDDDL